MKLTSLILMIIMLSALVGCSGCASLESIRFGSDGCVVWNVAVPDHEAPDTLKNVVVSICAPTLAEHIEKIKENVGQYVTIDDGVRCEKGNCGEVEQRMIQSMFSAPSP